MSFIATGGDKRWLSYQPRSQWYPKPSKWWVFMKDMCLYVVGKRLYNIFPIKWNTPTLLIALKDPDGDPDGAPMVLPNLFVFSRSFCVCHRPHTSQCKISKPSGRLQFKAPSPVFAISTSPLPSVEATRQPHVPRLSQLEQIPTNLGQISTGFPICKNLLAEFLHFF